MEIVDADELPQEDVVANLEVLRPHVVVLAVAVVLKLAVEEETLLRLKEDLVLVARLPAAVAAMVAVVVVLRLLQQSLRRL